MLCSKMSIKTGKGVQCRHLFQSRDNTIIKCKLHNFYLDADCENDNYKVYPFWDKIKLCYGTLSDFDIFSGYAK